MSCYNFFTHFANSFLFSAITDTPLFSVPYYNPYMTMPSVFMNPMMCTPMSMPMAPMYQKPIFDFSNNNYQENLAYNSPSSTSNNWWNPMNWSFNFNLSNTSSTTNSNTDTNTPASPASSNSKASSTSVSHKGSSEKVTDLYKGTAEDLNKKLETRGVLKGKGAKFIEMQNKYGISASFLASICIQESGGTSAQATDSRNLHNVAGIRSGNGWRKFSSVDECIEYLAKLIKNNYVDKGLVTVAQIHKKYCPISDPQDKTGMNSGWGAGVSSRKAEIDSAIA